jgi:hypothetical protein
MFKFFHRGERYFSFIFACHKRNSDPPCPAFWGFSGLFRVFRGWFFDGGLAALRLILLDF